MSIKFDAATNLSLGKAMSEKTHADTTPRKKLTPEAQRALAEAEARRKSRKAQLESRPKETNGPEGAEPTRYGDWERGGITYDF